MIYLKQRISYINDIILCQARQLYRRVYHALMDYVLACGVRPVAVMLAYTATWIILAGNIGVIFSAGTRSIPLVWRCLSSTDDVDTRCRRSHYSIDQRGLTVVGHTPGGKRLSKSTVVAIMDNRCCGETLVVEQLIPTTHLTRYWSEVCMPQVQSGAAQLLICCPTNVFRVCYLPKLVGLCMSIYNIY